jgi:cobalt/nickel transport system permease protein
MKAATAALTVSVVMAAFARLDRRALFNRLKIINVFVLFLWVVIPFSYLGDTGRVVFRMGPLAATHEGFLFVLLITMKTNAVALATISLLGTSEVFSLAHALVHLRVPKKLVYLFFFFYRYISVMHEEYLRLRRAMTLRSFKPGTNIHTYRSYAYLIGMLLVRSFERSERIYRAMLARGFQGKFPVMRHFHLHVTDVVFAAAMMAVAGGLGWWGYY